VGRSPVTERTREIGIRLAVGARGRDILAQFLVEAVTLATIGGGMGAMMGVLGADEIAAVAGWRTVIRADSVLLALTFSGGVGVVFGLYPARRAARLDPIEALRR
jgi:putative ABC transport system permease protein